MLELITNRTQADVNAGNDKGTYGAVDFNRVSDAMEYLVDALNGYGYSVPGYISAGRWEDDGKPTMSQLERYRQNVAFVRAALVTLPTTPQTPGSIRFINYEAANDIERILLDVEQQINTMIKTFVPCGPATSGGDYL